MKRRWKIEELLSIKCIRIWTSSRRLFHTPQTHKAPSWITVSKRHEMEKAWKFQELPTNRIVRYILMKSPAAHISKGEVSRLLNQKHCQIDIKAPHDQRKRYTYNWGSLGKQYSLLKNFMPQSQKRMNCKQISFPPRKKHTGGDKTSQVSSKAQRMLWSSPKP